MYDHKTDISNILVIGCGGSGLRAAIEAKLAGYNVKILGKRDKDDAHTVLAAGGINAPLGNLDEKDSWEQHFADTYIEGYGIGDPTLIETMAKESSMVVKEIDSWGANFAKLPNGSLDQRFFGAHTYRRTCYSGDYTGKSILKALLRKAEQLKIPIDDHQYVTDLLVDDGVCFGAASFNMKTGEKCINLSDSVIICTGGHTKIWKKSSSRKLENTGDGFYLALKAGCELVDMEMVQFHPTGMILPESVAGTLVTEAVRGEGGILLNSKGERFMINYDSERMELSTRDRVAKANYTEIEEGRGTANGGVYLDISHKDKEFIIEKIPSIYRQFLELQSLDISQYPMEVAPTAHYSMGGIKVFSKKHSTSIKGLFAAGEVAGGLHGANRLGGNSLAEILVFGKLSGKAAVEYSRSIRFQKRNPDLIKKSINNIEKHIKKGNELIIPLQNQLSEIMWKFCGVLKDKSKLDKGLLEVNNLEKKLEYLDVRVGVDNYQDLINAFDFEASIYVAKATIISAKNRLESIGSHQRSDSPQKILKDQFNNFINMDSNKKLFLTSRGVSEIEPYLNNIVSKTKKIKNFSGRLLE